MARRRRSQRFREIFLRLRTAQPDRRSGDQMNQLSSAARPARFTLLFLSLLAAFLGFATDATVGRPHDDHGHQSHKPSVKVMTRNLCLGADLTRSIVASTIPGFLAANAQIWTNVQQSDLHTRARLVAREIARTRRPAQT